MPIIARLAAGMPAVRSGMICCVLTVLCVFNVPVLAQQSETLRIVANEQAQALLREAEKRIAANRSQSAYDLLLPQEAVLAGNAYFDYLLGVAALDSGRSSEAIFSLRRSLAVEPAFSAARMELARAYFESGNRQLARPLFLQLLTEDPPPAVDIVINEYIRAIDARPREQGSRFIPYVQLFAGYDDNANGSTDSQNFLGFTLSPDNVKTDSPFAEISAGFQWALPRGTRLTWIASARASHRANPDADFIDASVLSGSFGLAWQRNDWFGRAALESYWGSRDSHYNEKYAGLDLSVGHRLGEQWDVTLGLRGGGLRHHDAIEVLDVNRLLFSLGTSWRFANSARLSVQALGGNDNERNPGSPYGNSKVGGRISLTAAAGPRAVLSASIGSMTTDYDGLFFGVSREDDQFTGLLQLEFRDVLTKGLSLTPRLRYIDNDSDVDLYSYDRTEIGLQFRWSPRQ